MTQEVDLLLTNGLVFNPFTLEWIHESIAIQDGKIIGLGTYPAKKVQDCSGFYIAPGFIDAHAHIESSFLSPCEYSVLAAQHGTTTTIADPHEIANVCGTQGIEYMQQNHCITDIRYTLPSCVPATPIDACAQPLCAATLSSFLKTDASIIALGEVMNVPGVLAGDLDLMQKLDLLVYREGHAPMLTGNQLDAYINAGIQSDHETNTYQEGYEKLRRGMYLYIRQGSTEKNLPELIPLATHKTAPRCCFCTDDRDAIELMQKGAIDDCIRLAIAHGCEPEIAYRIATLSAAERFGLHDRGACTPGRRADLVILSDMQKCIIHDVLLSGRSYRDTPVSPPPKSPIYPFHATIPSPCDLRVSQSGIATVIALHHHHIDTTAMEVPVHGEQIPDLARDILKVVVVSRYTPHKMGIGLVYGFAMKRGAIASSVSHDSHNIIAVGTSDEEICAALAAVIEQKGGIAIVDGKERNILPLPIAGLMSDISASSLCERLGEIEDCAARCGACSHAYMYLSFLALTVIPEVRITERGVFDGRRGEDIALFSTTKTVLM
ncbi:MAG: adenine deaminase [Methanomicrobiales archaeon]|jgi:adenine deaminase|nr:adenine deaminase [Methanomicrobiales archaeon]